MRADTRTLRAVAALLALTFVVTALAGDALAKKPWERLKFPELGEVTIPDYERHVLDNGLVIYLLEDHTWPLVEGEVLVRAGGAFEPAAKAGLASIMGDVLRTGGTTTISADELDEMLENMGAYIESGVGDTQGSVDFSFLSKDAEGGLGLVADVIRNPAFDQEKIDLTLTGVRAGISRRNDDMNQIVSREIQRAVWGDEHPYARNVEYATLDAITREDIVGFYDYFYSPENMMIAVWGDFDPDSMLAALGKHFGDWPRAGNPVPELPNEPMQTQRRRVLVADKQDVNQSRFAMGHVGIQASDPDYYAMSVANRILGGGFGDRLFNEVRTNRGLAYNVGSSAGVSLSRPGTFQAYCATKSGTTEEAMGVVLDVIEGMRTDLVGAQELGDAKEAILNSAVFDYVSPQQVLTRKMSLEYLGYPDDFLETYNEKVRAVDAGSVLDVMQRRVDPEQFAIVAVGKTDEWDGDLASFGPVEQLDITIPEPEGPEFPEPTDEAVEKGRATLAAAQKAHGGRALIGLESVVREEDVALSMGGMDMSIVVSAQVIFPDRGRTTIALPFGEVIQVIDGETGWMQTPQGIQDVAGEQAQEMRAGVLSDPLYVLGHFDGFPVQLLESEDVEGTQANVVLVWIDDEAGDWLKLYFDPTTNVLVKSQSKGNHPMTQAPGIQDTFYSDVKAVSGIQIPHSARMLHDGEQVMALTTKKVTPNAKIDASVFVRPSS